MSNMSLRGIGDGCSFAGRSAGLGTEPDSSDYIEYYSRYQENGQYIDLQGLFFQYAPVFLELVADKYQC
jgi:hypothetical protein